MDSELKSQVSGGARCSEEKTKDHIGRILITVAVVALPAMLS